MSAPKTEAERLSRDAWSLWRAYRRVEPGVTTDDVEHAFAAAEEATERHYRAEIERLEWELHQAQRERDSAHAEGHHREKQARERAERAEAELARIRGVAA